MDILKKYRTLLTVLICSALVLYAAFIFALPRIVNLNNYKDDIQKIFLDNLKLNIDIKDIKIITTPTLKAGISVSDVKISYPDSKEIASTDNAQIAVSLVPLLWRTVQISDIKTDSLSLNVKRLKNGQPDIVEYILDNTTQNSQSSTNTSLELPVKISEKLPEVIVNEYNLKLDDETTKNTIEINGEHFYFDKAVLNKRLRVSTDGKVLINGKTNATYDITVSSIWPAVSASNDKQQTQQLPEFDFVKELVKYDPHVNITANLDIKEHKGHLDVNGFFKAADMNLKINGNKLPNSNFYLKANGHKTEIDSTFFVSENEKAVFRANIKNGHKTKLDLNLKTDKISFSSIQNFAIAFLNSLNIKNDLSTVKMQGFLKADFNIKTDLKKLESNGYFQIQEGSVSHRLIPVSINEILADIDFSDNNAKIKTAQAIVNGSRIIAKGTIDSSSVTDISVTSNDINIAPLFNAFAPSDLKKTYLLNSGILNIEVIIKGKLAEMQPDIDIALSQFILKTRSPMPPISIKIPTLKIDMSPNDILLNPFDILLNSSKIKVTGSIKNYMKDMKININANGALCTSDIMTLLPNEAKAFVGHQGFIPLKGYIGGDLKQINITAQAYPNSKNHFSPVSIKKMIGTNGLVNVEMTYSNDSLNINDASLYMSTKKSYADDFLKNKKGAEKLAGISGYISDISSACPKMKINILVPELLILSNQIMPDTSVKIRGDINVNGSVAAPSLQGFFYIKDGNMPSLLTKVQEVDIEFNNDTLNAQIQNLAFNGSSMNIEAETSTKFSNIFLIKSLKITSPEINIDNLFKVMDKINALMSQTGTTGGSTTNSNAPFLPVKISNGNFNIQKLLMKQVGGTLTTSDITGDFTLVNDLVKIPNLKISVYNGNINGVVSYNLKTTETNANIKGLKINANPIVTVFAGLKDQITGDVDFSANVTLRGADYTQQIKTLNGKIHFDLKDGQLGSLGRIETFLNADNLLSQSFISTQTGSLISAVAPYNTGKFAYLSGDVNLINGNAVLDSIKMSGPHMSLLLTGTVNILSMNSTLQILGSLSSEVINALGPIAELSVGKFASYIPKFGAKIVSALNTYNEAANKNTLASIPVLSPEKTNTKSFKVILNGNLNNPATAVKQFKWLNTPEEIKTEQESLTEAVTPKQSISKKEIKTQVKQDITNALQKNEKVQEIQQNKAVKTLNDIYKFYKSASKTTTTETQEKSTEQ